MLTELAQLDQAALGSAPWARASLLALSSARRRNLWRYQLSRMQARLPEEDQLLEAERQFCADAARAGVQLPLGRGLLCCYRERWWWEHSGPAAATEARVWSGEPEIAWGRGRLRFIPDPAGGVLATFRTARRYQGYAGILHGGVISTLLDAAMVHCLFARGVTAVTAEMTVRFLREVPVDCDVCVGATLIGERHGVFQAVASLSRGGTRFAVAKGKFCRSVR